MTRSTPAEAGAEKVGQTSTQLTPHVGKVQPSQKWLLEEKARDASQKGLVHADAVKVFGYILSGVNNETGMSWQSQSTLAKRAQVGKERLAKTLIPSLADIGLLEYACRKTPTGHPIRGEAGTTIYRPNWELLGSAQNRNGQKRGSGESHKYGSVQNHYPNTRKRGVECDAATVGLEVRYTDGRTEVVTIAEADELLRSGQAVAA